MVVECAAVVDDPGGTLGLLGKPDLDELGAALRRERGVEDVGEEAVEGHVIDCPGGGDDLRAEVNDGGQACFQAARKVGIGGPEPYQSDAPAVFVLLGECFDNR